MFPSVSPILGSICVKNPCQVESSHLVGPHETRQMNFKLVFVHYKSIHVIPPQLPPELLYGWGIVIDSGRQNFYFKNVKLFTLLI